MKAYIEFIGNEDRRPKTGERFEDENGSIVVACYDHEEIRRMVTRHEIEIPKKFTEVKIIAGSLCDLDAVVRIFPIPRPKVKKWIYEFVCKGVTWRSACPISEAEYASQPTTGHKMPETMIEVEE
jgi:hypothetical protein